MRADRSCTFDPPASQSNPTLLHLGVLPSLVWRKSGENHVRRYLPIHIHPPQYFLLYNLHVDIGFPVLCPLYSLHPSLFVHTSRKTSKAVYHDGLHEFPHGSRTLDLEPSSKQRRATPLQLERPDECHHRSPVCQGVALGVGHLFGNLDNACKSKWKA